MALTKEQWASLTPRLNDVTNKLAAKLQAAKDALTAALANAGVDAATEQEAFDNIDTAIKGLELLGADEANPVPNGNTV